MFPALREVVLNVPGKTVHEVGKSMHDVGKSMHGVGKSMHGLCKSMHGMGKSMHGVGKSMHGMGKSMHEAGQSRHEVGGQFVTQIALTPVVPEEARPRARQGRRGDALRRAVPERRGLARGSVKCSRPCAR